MCKAEFRRRPAQASEITKEKSPAISPRFFHCEPTLLHYCFHMSFTPFSQFSQEAPVHQFLCRLQARLSTGSQQFGRAILFRNLRQQRLIRQLLDCSSSIVLLSSAILASYSCFALSFFIDVFFNAYSSSKSSVRNIKSSATFVLGNTA